MTTIPLQPIPSQELQVLLDGQPCTLSVYWRHWRLYADLYVGDEAVFLGAVCLNGQAVNQSPSADFSGTLVFVDTRGAQHPRWDGLGDRWRLVYLPDGETLESAVAADLDGE